MNCSKSIVATLFRCNITALITLFTWTFSNVLNVRIIVVGILYLSITAPEHLANIFICL